MSDMEKKNINFSVKEVYFNAIESGAKTVEYRDGTNPYWWKKLCDLTRYGDKDIDTVMDEVRRGKMEFHPQPYQTCTFWTTRKNNTRASLVIEWKDTVVHKGHSTFAVRLGDLLVDSNGKHIPKKK